MKRIIQIILILGIIIGGIYYYMNFIKKNETGEGNPTFGITQVLIENEKINEGGENYTVDITYPKTTIEFIDNDTFSFITGILNKFKSDIENETPCVDCPDWQKTLFINYEVVHNNDGIFSLKFSTETFLGGAHPTHIISTKNYGLKEKKIIKFEDVITGQALLDKISQISSDYFKHQQLEYDLFVDGFEAKKENYLNFNLKKDSIVFYFQEYQIAPYVAGPQQIEIKLIDLNK